MTVKNINSVIVRLLLIFILFHLSNYNLFCALTPPGKTPRNQIDHVINFTGPRACKEKNIQLFREVITYLNTAIQKHPRLREYINQAIRNIIREALVFVQSPVDDRFLQGILNQISGFALEINLNDAMIRAGLALGPAPIQAEIIQQIHPADLAVVVAIAEQDAREVPLNEAQRNRILLSDNTLADMLTRPIDPPGDQEYGMGLNLAEGPIACENLRNAQNIIAANRGRGPSEDVINTILTGNLSLNQKRRICLSDNIIDYLLSAEYRLPRASVQNPNGYTLANIDACVELLNRNKQVQTYDSLNEVRMNMGFPEDFMTFVINGLSECSVCLGSIDFPENIIVLHCAHFLCKDCFRAVKQARHLDCPICREAFNDDDLDKMA